MAKKKKTYMIIRKVAETYYCDAETKEEAQKIIGKYGGPSTVVILSEKIKVVR